MIIIFKKFIICVSALVSVLGAIAGIWYGLESKFASNSRLNDVNSKFSTVAFANDLHYIEKRIDTVETKTVSSLELLQEQLKLELNSVKLDIVKTQNQHEYSTLIMQKYQFRELKRKYPTDIEISEKLKDIDRDISMNRNLYNELQ
jgi:hypothetical protein